MFGAQKGHEMRTEEATKFIDIMMTADDGCNICVAKLLRAFVQQFPEFRDIAETSYSREFEDSL